ncbi:carbamoyltransferase family protein [Amycolatopsis cihanbeyliensis]|nr:carbamoyltransferase C-terminal domain-containing protein [Amycolatopsis cihanbeyliensis]
MPDYYFHDATACIVRDGVLVAAVEEERLNRIKKTTKFPINAIRACLDIANATPDDVDAVGYYFEETFADTMLNTWQLQNPKIPVRRAREIVKDMLRGGLDWELSDDRLRFTDHHRAHALSSYARSGMADALVVVLDGRGEDISGTIFRAGHSGLRPLKTYPLYKSLGGFYEAAIQLAGYRFGDEYKVMGLAPYGDPNKYRDIFDRLYLTEEGGDYEINPAAPTTFFLNGFRPRRKGEEFTQEHMDFAAGLQETLETIVLHILRHWSKATGLNKLCFTGGVAHNSTLNGRIIESGLFDEVFIHPASHDAGAAEGGALAAAVDLGGNPFGRPRLRSASLGPSLGHSDDIERTLKAWSAMLEVERPTNIVDRAADLLAEGSVIGWAQGRSEFGPRALGNRSIIADARPSENRHKINAMVKKREGYRPFAPVVTAEAAERYFELPPTKANYDFMSYVVSVRPEHRELLGAITHVDGSARLQVIHPEVNERYHGLVRRFGELTGTPVLLNTSFNNNAEPIVQTVEDVLTCFLTTDLDLLVIDDFVVRRRAGGELAFDDFRITFRPVAKLAKNVRVTSSGEREVVHEISLDYYNGPRATVSKELFSVLEGVDGSSTLSSLAREAGVELTGDLRRELGDLWQARFLGLSSALE